MTSSLKFIPPVIAHRGASAYAPENTMPAFIKAAQLGMTWVEFDVVLTSDDVAVIFHDETLDRTTDGHGNIEEFPYDYLQTLDAGRWFNPFFSGERIPTLKQVIDFLISVKINANIELKSSPQREERLVEVVTKDLSSYLTNNDIQLLFSSFSVNALRLLREYSSSYLIGILLHEWSVDWHKNCFGLNCASIHVNQEIMTREQALEIKVMNKALLTYTVNTPQRAKELFNMGVDAIFSDVPDKIAKMIPQSEDNIFL